MLALYFFSDLSFALPIANSPLSPSLAHYVSLATQAVRGVLAAFAAAGHRDTPLVHHLCAAVTPASLPRPCPASMLRSRLVVGGR